MMNVLKSVALWSFFLSVSTSVQADYQQELVRLDSEALAFVQADGFIEADVDSLTDDSYYSSNTFSGLAGGQASLSWPDADLDALTRAVLLLDSREASLPHVRYLLRYSTNVSPDFPEVQHDYVEITRFNLGPQRRRDLLEYVAEENVASLTEFGVGPHVSWRFALTPVMGMRAGLIYASRKEVSDTQADTLDCLGEPCLSLLDAEGPALDWVSVEQPSLGDVPYHDRSLSGSARAARIVHELWAAMSSYGMDPLPYTAGQPQFVFVASVDVSGQDASAFGLALQAIVMDHTVQAIWTRRHDIPGMHVEFTQTSVPRR